MTFAALALFIAFRQDLSPRDAIGRMTVADGFRVDLAAAEPQIRQPVTMSFDGRGRIWVIQYLQYPAPAGLTAVKVDEYLRTVYDRVPEPPPKGPRGADRITILEDQDGDGFFESAKDFVAGLNLASGLCLGPEGVYVAQPPYLLYYPDRNRDDVPDGDPEVLLTGFGMEDAHAFANSLQWGPDGWLYGAHGSTSTAKIRGIEFQQGIWRYHPGTKQFELFAEGGGNTWGVDFDRHGNLLAGTNWGGFAMLHQVQGAYYLKGFGKHGPLHNPNTYGYFDHVPCPNFQGGHVTCGGLVYQGGAFPKEFDDAYIACNPLSNAIYWYRLEPKGSSFTSRHAGELLVSKDPWFRPIDLQTGPEGALYVVDWHDARLNHVDPRDNWDRRNGRIYRISWKNASRERPGVRRFTAEGSDLTSPDEHARAWAVRLLGDRRATSPALVSLARSDPSPRVRSQLACTAKRLPAAEGLPIVRELLRRAEDVDDPHLPMLLWWAIEDKAISDSSLLLESIDWTSPIVRSHLVERIGRRYIAEGDFTTAALLLARVPSDLTEKLIAGMEKALEGRRLPAVPTPLAAAAADVSTLPRLTFAIRLGSEPAYVEAMKRVEAGLDGAVLLPLLGQIGRADALPAILQALAGPATRAAALGALGPYADPRIPSALLAQWPSLPRDLRGRALGLLSGRPAWAPALVKAVERGAVAKADVPLDVLQRLAAVEEIRPAVEKIWGKVGAATPGEKRAQIASIRHILGQGKGDAIRGKATFTRLCAVCHTFRGEGNKIGPELDGADRRNLEALISNIVDPSGIIRPEYHAAQILTSDDSVLTGLLVEQTSDAVVLLDAQNARTVIPRGRIQAMKPSTLSLMPEKLIDPLSDGEIRDFFAYLQGDVPKKAPPLKVCLVSGSLEYESDASLAALQEHLEKNFNATCTRAFRRTDDDLPGLEALETCDVLLVFTRRIKLTGEQLERVKKYCAAGKPIVAVRTASHAFQTWLELDKEVLGGSYSNHFGKGPDCLVTFTDKGKAHPILEGVTPFTSKGSLYKNPKNAADTETLLTGTAGPNTEPVAWWRLHKGGRVFTTSLGDQGDFKNPHFVRMIVNALFWTSNRAPEKKQANAGPLPGTAPLELDGDLAARMVAGIDRFLLKEIEASVDRRARHWTCDLSSANAYEASLKPNRERLKQILGIVDVRVPFEAPLRISTETRDGLEISTIRWPAVRGVEGEGLMILPRNRPVEGNIILLVDPSVSGEEWACRLAENGRRVFLPLLIDRNDRFSVSQVGRATNQPHREFVYRPAFEMGRHILGYEIQKVLALVDWLTLRGETPAIEVIGFGEGGFIALPAAAVDPRIDAIQVCDSFGPRQEAWKEPIYRNVWRLLDEFGDAELVSMVRPRSIVFSLGHPVQVNGPPTVTQGRSGAAPGAWTTPVSDLFQREVKRSEMMLATAKFNGNLPKAGTLVIRDPVLPAAPPLQGAAAATMKRQVEQLLEDTQVLLRRSERVRDEYFWKRVSRKSLPEFEASTEPMRKEFVDDVIGRFDLPLLPANPRSRQVYDEPKYRGYEVVLDVFPDVYAYGILLLPKDLKDGERRPVVVCQHGLEGRPQDVADPKKNHPAYGQYGCRLAERGFVVFAPQNPYIGGDAFRTLQRKANLLGKQLFSIILPQHDQITRWLAAQPFVDPDRIAFYGLSYGGKTAMRVPAALHRYCLSICSADFNEWIWKNVALDSTYSYVTTNEYEIFEWNLGHTFNYAEMAALIAPRPFMVERGHDDGVAPDERVAYEFAKVKRLYVKLGIGDRAEIEYFNGPHKINGVGTFEFLHRHLKWPKPD